MRRIKQLVVGLTMLICFGAHGQEAAERLHAELEELFAESQLPGFAVAIVNGDSLLFQEAYGYENLAHKKAFSPHTRFNIASVSKPFIGIGLMQLVETGAFALSTPINEILPFKVVNPRHPEVQITIEHLARHTSSIQDADIEQRSWYLDNDFPLAKKQLGKEAYGNFTAWQKNNPAPLSEFLAEALVENGKHYSKKRFSKHRPGKTYGYSNLGAALGAYIVELRAGKPYGRSIEQLVEEQFGFPKRIWKHETKKLPTTYFQNTVEVPAYKPILYPTGGMMLSSQELSLFLMEMIRGYQGMGTLLEPESFKLMMTASEEGHGDNGIFWELGERTIGHNGGNYGTLCFIGFTKDTGVGKVFMTNMSSYGNERVLQQAIAIWKKMSGYEARL